MTIPPFNERGLLPPTDTGAGYPCQADEVEKRLVTELGSPEWRVSLFEGWDLLRRGVRQIVPIARWWLWGCFVSNHVTPLYGEHETVSAIVILPAADVPSDETGIMLLDFVQGALDRHRVDAGYVFEFGLGHPAHLETVDALEIKYRPRAMVGVADHRSGELVPAGFLEVLP
jgi:hypothetical protein